MGYCADTPAQIIELIRLRNEMYHRDAMQSTYGSMEMQDIAYDRLDYAIQAVEGSLEALKHKSSPGIPPAGLL